MPPSAGGATLLLSCPCHQLICTHASRSSSTVLPRHSPGEVRALLSQVLHLMRGRASSPTLMTLWATFLTPSGRERWQGINSIPVPPHDRQEAESVLPRSLPQAGSLLPLPLLLPPGPFHCAIWARCRAFSPEHCQSQLSRVPHPVRDRDSYTQSLDIHMVSGGCPDQGHRHVL